MSIHEMTLPDLALLATSWLGPAQALTLITNPHLDCRHASAPVPYSDRALAQRANYNTDFI